VPATDWLAHHDIGSAKGATLQTARDAARGQLLTLGAGLFTAGALLFTARNFTLSREGQVTDRYTRAIEQLGSEKLDVRIGGIYALERIARDSARDHPTVMEVLSAFIREHSREQWPKPAPDGTTSERSTRPDIQAALTVIGRRDTRRDIPIRPVDLSGADLTRAVVYDAKLPGAWLTDANLTSVHLPGANLTRALLQANLTGADLGFAHLTGASLTGAHLTGARLTGADLRHAQLMGADLRGADLRHADLTGADLRSADLRTPALTEADPDPKPTNLSGANLTGANLYQADLTGADLTDATWPANEPIPEGWKLNTVTGSRRLLAEDSDSGPAEAN
jgi:hypothetical protein